MNCIPIFGQLSFVDVKYYNAVVSTEVFGDAEFCYLPPLYLLPSASITLNIILTAFPLLLK